jgi:hypothetical protein
MGTPGFGPQVVFRGEQPAPQFMGRRMIRIDANRRFGVIRGFVDPASGGKQGREVGLPLGNSGIDPKGLPELPFRAICVASPEQHLPEIVVEVGGIGIQPDRGLERRAGFGLFILLPKDPSQQTPGGGIVRAQCLRSAKRGLCRNPPVRLH